MSFAVIFLNSEVAAGDVDDIEYYTVKLDCKSGIGLGVGQTILVLSVFWEKQPDPVCPLTVHSECVVDVG